METKEETSGKFSTAKNLIIPAVIAAVTVQVANLGYHYYNSEKPLPEELPKQVQILPKIDETNYAVILKETRDLVLNQNYAQAAMKLDTLVKSKKNKILLEVAKIRIRRDTPLYSYELASKILLSLIDVTALRGEAAFLLARHHMRALDEHTQSKATALLHQAIEWEYEKAHAYLGDVYSKGIGTPQQLVIALSHYEDAATRFSAAPIVAFARRIASFKAGEIDCGIKAHRIVERHLPSLQIEARGGKVSAAKELGRVFYKGKLIERDISEARKWLTSAANTGDSGAMRDLALLEMKFPASDSSMDIAISLLEKSAKAGNPSAYTSLGRIYLKEKTPEMEKKAIEAFETAALSGHKAAIGELAALNEKFDENIGVDPVVTGSISSPSPSSTASDSNAYPSQEITDTSNQKARIKAPICELPEESKYNNVSAYLE